MGEGARCVCLGREVPGGESPGAGGDRGWCPGMGGAGGVHECLGRGTAWRVGGV